MSRLRGRPPGAGGRKRSSIGWGAWLRAGLGLFTWAAASLILLGYDLFPGRVSLRVGERSRTTIRAPRTAQYVDLEETERLRQAAEQQAALAPRFSPVPFAVADAEHRLDRVFQELAAAREQPASRRAAASEQFSHLPGDSLTWAKSLSTDRLEALRDQARAILRQVMSQEIRQGTGDTESAREEAAALARRGQSVLGGPKGAALVAAVVQREIRANRQRDEEAARTARAEARARVQEVVRIIPADYPILFPGDVVTRQHLAMLKAVGLAGPTVDWRRALSVALLVAVIAGLLGAHTYRMAAIYARPELLLLLSLLLVVALFVVNLLALSLPNSWLLVAPAAVLMGAVLLGEAIGLALAISLSLLVGLMASGGLIAALLSLGCSAAALTCVSYLWPISRLRRVVGVTAAVNLVLVAATGLLQHQDFTTVLREAGLAAALYGPGAAALALGGIFLLQRPFGITTHLGLLELSNPRHPLLRRLQAEAPGTYYASMMVADLADACAEAAGADGLLARVGALYHDLGKLQRPTFFVENQGLLSVDNAHDRLSSSLSGLVIISHVKDGVELARKHRLPPEVLEIIEQHHGNTLVSYFYQRALTSDRPESVTEDHFRYPGPLPRSKEATLVMLADSVQAAVRSIAEPTPQRVQQMVRDIIRDRAVDGQLKESDLTFRDVAAVEATMARALTALLCHTRIEYPESAYGGARA